MPLHDIYSVSIKHKTVSVSELDELEATLGFDLPVGYREYLSELGDGYFCGNIHVRTPSGVLNKENVGHWDKVVELAVDFEAWDEQRFLSDSELKNAVVFAKSDEGDLFVACPEKVGQLYELPRGESRMYHYPKGFLEPFHFRFCREVEFNLP